MKKKIIFITILLTISVLSFADSWLLCLGSFNSKQEAEKRIENLEKHGIQANLSEFVTVDGTKFYRVFFDEKMDDQKDAESHKRLILSIKDLDIPESDIWISKIIQKTYADYEAGKAVEYKTTAEASFNSIAQKGGGTISYTFGTEDLSNALFYAINDIKSYPNVEIVFVLDTTGSMDDDFVELYTNWLPKLEQQIKTFNSIRLGLLLYKDYGDEYDYNSLPVKNFGFTSSVNTLTDWIKSAYVGGGNDDPEAVYEALYAGINYFDWSDGSKKKIILIGDAEPHPSPRGSIQITEELVTRMAKEKDISLDCIIIMPEYMRSELSGRDYIRSRIRTVDSDDAVKEIINSVETAK